VDENAFLETHLPQILCGAWGVMRTPHLLNNDSLEKEVGTVQRQQLLSLFTPKVAVWQAVIPM
jgi:hypothetical protein